MAIVFNARHEAGERRVGPGAPAAEAVITIVFGFRSSSMKLPA